MGVGTSDGDYYEHEMEYSLAQHIDVTPNIDIPNPKPYKNKEMNTWDANDFYDAMWDDHQQTLKNKQGKPTEEEMFKMSPAQLRQYVKPTADPLDYTHRFNTPLTEQEQTQFDQKFSKGDKYDYDMQGWFKLNQDKMMGEGQHFPDTFKKPNHPTFSDESIYHGGEYQGGKWGNEDGKDTFTPGDTNMNLHGRDRLQDYFKSTEPDVILKQPEKRGDLFGVQDKVRLAMDVTSGKGGIGGLFQKGKEAGGGGIAPLNKSANDNVRIQDQDYFIEPPSIKDLQAAAKARNSLSNLGPEEYRRELKRRGIPDLEMWYKSMEQKPFIFD